MTNLESLFWTVTGVVGFALIFGFLFAAVGTIAGFLIGLGISMYYERVLGIGNPQGPLLFLLTAPVGFLVGLIFGAWKGFALTRRFRVIAKSDA